MYKTVFVVLALATAIMAEPKPAVLAAYSAPVVAPAVVTAQSSQFYHRNHNGLVAPIVAAAPLVKSQILASPVMRTAPLVAAPIAYSSPYYNPYFAAAPYFAAPTPVFV